MSTQRPEQLFGAFFFYPYGYLNMSNENHHCQENIRGLKSFFSVRWGMWTF